MTSAAEGVVQIWVAGQSGDVDTVLEQIPSNIAAGVAEGTGDNCFFRMWHFRRFLGKAAPPRLAEAPFVFDISPVNGCCAQPHLRRIHVQFTCASPLPGPSGFRLSPE